MLIFRCTHGMKEIPPEKISDFYGESKKWPKFETLKRTVYHGGTCAICILYNILLKTVLFCFL